MRDDTAYREFLSDFLARKIDLFGHVALTRAQAVPGLELDARGRVVRFGADAFAIVEGVLDTFERLSGRASCLTVEVSLRALNLLETYPGLEIPSRGSGRPPRARA
jgi:hypothetical protein